MSKFDFAHLQSTELSTGLTFKTAGLENQRSTSCLPIAANEESRLVIGCNVCALSVFSDSLHIPALVLRGVSPIR